MAATPRDVGIPTGSGKFDILNTIGSDEEESSSSSSLSELSEEEGIFDRVSDSDVSHFVCFFICLFPVICRWRLSL